MKAKAYVTGLGLAAKIMLGAGVAAAATAGAGAVGVLPASFHAAEHHTDAEPPLATTTTTPSVNHEEHHDGDHPVVVVEPTTTSTTIRHDEPHEPPHDHPSTTTTTMRHEEPTTTTTVRVESHNPESIALSCEPAREPDRIICHWTASTNPEHRRYALLQTNNINSQGRVAFQTEDRLEYADTYVTRTAQFTYRVVSLREDGSTESHSNAVTVTCC